MQATIPAVVLAFANDIHYDDMIANCDMIAMRSRFAVGINGLISVSTNYIYIWVRCVTMAHARTGDDDPGRGRLGAGGAAGRS